MKTLSPSASSIVCWLIVSALFSSCSLTRRVHKQTVTSTVSTVTTTDSLSSCISTSIWHGSDTQITIRHITFDTTRLSASGRPLPLSETTTTIHRRDSTTTSSDASTTSVTHTDQHVDQQQQQVTNADTGFNFMQLSDAACMAVIIIICIFAWSTFTSRR